MENTKDFLVGAMIGGVIGATAALLLAPKAGSELREDISDTYEDISERTQEFATNASRKGHCLAKNISSQATDLADKARDLVDTVSSGIKSFKEGFENGTGTVVKKVKQESSRLEDILDWAEFGIDLWQKFSKRR